MVGPLLERLGLDLVEAYWTPDGNFPDHEPNPLLPENREFIMARGRRARGPTWGSPGTGTPTAASSSTSTGAFVDGDFLTALLTAARCSRRSPAPPSSTTCGPAGRCADTAQRRGGRALVNRVGHAFFKTRMRAEGAAFGGEVSGHYYFRDFYCADSGTLPGAADPRAALAPGDARMSELLEPYRSRYFISGEINTEVADPEAKIEELAERYADGRQSRLDGDLGRLRRLALQRPPLQHRAAAAAVPGVAALARAHGGQARRGAGPDPLVTPTGPATDGARAALRRRRSAGIHRIAAADAVPGRAGQLLPDRGRAADAGRHRPQLGQVAGRARAGARAPSGTRSRTSS